jgi:hypothetical protein
MDQLRPAAEHFPRPAAEDLVAGPDQQSHFFTSSSTSLGLNPGLSPSSMASARSTRANPRIVKLLAARSIGGMALLLKVLFARQRPDF